MQLAYNTSFSVGKLTPTSVLKVYMRINDMLTAAGRAFSRNNSGVIMKQMVAAKNTIKNIVTQKIKIPTSKFFFTFFKTVLTEKHAQTERI